MGLLVKSLAGIAAGGRRYLGQVAGQVMTPNATLLAASATQLMSRKPVYARVPITSLQLIYPNWYMDATLAEAGSGNAITITAAIEYPVGVTCTQVKWGGVASIAVADLTNAPLSDACLVNIPKDAKFFIRTYVTSTVAAPVHTAAGAIDAPNTGQFRFATSGLSDQTMTPGNLTGGSSSTNYIYNPLVIAGPTTAPSVLILGDSRQEGNAAAESYVGTSGDKGTIARCVGPFFAYCNLGKGSDSALKFLAGNALRSAIKQYFSHVICGYGINDVVTLSRTAVATYADIQAIRALFPSHRFFQLTLSPMAATSSAYATLAGQTTNARNSERIAFNALVLAGAGLSGSFDLTAVAENVPNSDGKWIVPANGRTVTDAAANSGNPNLASASAAFTAGDNGGTVVCTALGFTSALNRTMTQVDASNVTMSGNATATLAGQTAFINAQKYTWDGTHETTAMNELYRTSNVIPPAAITR